MTEDDCACRFYYASKRKALKRTFLIIKTTIISYNIFYYFDHKLLSILAQFNQLFIGKLTWETIVFSKVNESHRM